MKLVRNSNPDGLGKYAVIKTADLPTHIRHPAVVGEWLSENPSALDYGAPETQGEFFVLRLRDRFAQEALLAYASAAEKYDPEYAEEVRKLAERAGPASAFCKLPD